MNKYVCVILGTFLSLGWTRCSHVETKREVKDLYTDVYMSMYHKFDKETIMDSIESGINRAFGLLPIERSPYQFEIRIYYLSVWSESFFRQRYDSGKLVSEIYNCGTKRIKDSMIMSIGTRITDTRTCSEDRLIKTNSLPFYKFAQSNYEGVLDGGNLHFFQIKEPNAKKKLIYVDDPFDLETNDPEVKAVSDYLRSLKSKFGFNMFDHWDEIKANAFLND